MINILSDYYPDSIPEVLTTSGGLAEKVDAVGNLLPFSGNTVVFLLDEDTKTTLHQVQLALHNACGFMLAQPLEMSTFHMTLHDLANSKTLPQRTRMEQEAREALDEIRTLNLTPIPMKATWTFNMVSTSIVLGLEPENDEAWAQLDNLYERFQKINPLPYALTPHITMAYFRPGIYEDTRTLRQAVGPVDLRLELHMDQLVLQDFDHMNAYHTIY
ncbi:MAG: hypothetical protein E7466_06235 [Ruminococcaceae bacterium]|nr:hypothetical protein [Oscillospiraceae bacterium]